MPSHRSIIAMLLGFTLLISPIADTAEASRPELVLRPDIVRYSEKQERWKSLAEAVEAGVLDARVVAALDRRESVKALVQFDAEAEIAQGIVGSTSRLKSVRQALDRIAPRLRILKAAALDSAPGVRIEDDFSYLPVSFVEFKSEAALLALLNRKGVSSVRHNGSGSPALAESLRVVGQPTALQAGYGGSGAAVVVLDTGVDYARSAFGNCSSPAVVGCRIMASRDFAPSDGRRDDRGLHGTNVAGIVAGVAPHAQILVGDVFNNRGIYRDRWVLKGINWAIASKRAGVDVRAINLSLGHWFTYWNKVCSSSPFTSAFRTAQSVGILPVVAAGNVGFDYHANHGFHSGISMPACTPGALSVAASYDANIGKKSWPWCVDRRTFVDKPVCWTQSGRTVGMFAPGAVIRAAGKTMSGTSQAAPHVAGAAAVLGAAYPGASTVQIESALKSSGPKVYDPGPRITRRRLDIPAALNTLFAGVETTPPAVSPPVQFLPEGTDVLPPDVPVAFEWSATDASGIYDYVVQILENGTPYWLELETRNTTQVLLDLAPGNRYQLAVAARDRAGNWSDWRYGPEFVPDVYQEDSPAIAYSSGWERLPWNQAWGGHQMSSITPEASTALSFSGMDVAWVGTAGPDNGFADLFIDGVPQEGVDTFNWDVVPRLLLASRHWETAGPHTVGVGVLGDGRVDVDAFIVLRP